MKNLKDKNIEITMLMVNIIEADGYCNVAS
jgi:hypothetical protein